MTLWLALGRLAVAGCTVDPDPAGTLARATLVASGVVVHLAAADPAEVQATVALREVQVGAVDSGFVLLRTELSNAGCPGDRVLPPGAEVVIATVPAADGSVWLSGCGGDVWLGETPPAGAGSAAVGGHWAGAPPPPAPPASAGLPRPGPQRARVARLGPVTLAGGVALAGDGSESQLEARVVKEGAAEVTLLVETDELEVVARVSRADLAPTPTRAVSPSPGVRLAPGAIVSVAGSTVAYDQAGIHTHGEVPADALGVIWTPVSDPPRAPPTGWITKDADLLQAPGGPAVATLSVHGDFGFAPTGRSSEGFTEVVVTAPGLRATGWLPSAVVVQTGVLHGYGRGGGYGPGTWIRVAPGLEFATPEGAAVFARASQEHLVRLVAQEGTTGWVLASTPWGNAAARVVCAAPPGPGTPCTPP
jgi:hypothetical protein